VSLLALAGPGPERPFAQRRGTAPRKRVASGGGLLECRHDVGRLGGLNEDLKFMQVDELPHNRAWLKESLWSSTSIRPVQELPTQHPNPPGVRDDLVLSPAHEIAEDG